MTMGGPPMPYELSEARGAAEYRAALAKIIRANDGNVREDQAAAALMKVWAEQPVTTLDEAADIVIGTGSHAPSPNGPELHLENSLSVVSLAIEVRRDPPKPGFRSWHWRLVDVADESIVAESDPGAYYPTRGDAIAAARRRRQALGEIETEWTRVDG